MQKIKRPDVLPGVTSRIQTGCGNMYVQMNTLDGKLIEVFASLGKTGGCAKAQCEAITRSITLGLKYGIPVEEFIDELQGIQCPNPVTLTKDKVLSCPDAIALALRNHVKQNGTIKEAKK